MEIKDLDHEEQLALVGLVELIGSSNREVTEEERSQIADVVQTLGSQHYRKLAAEADERFAGEEALREHLRRIGRQEAREVIYGAALGIALGDAMQENESGFLDWLAREWNVQVRFEKPGPG